MNKPTPELNRTQLLAKLKKMEVGDEEKKKIACILIGHSRIISSYFGYIYCGRCGEQIGDALGSVFDGSKHVIIGHRCPTCRENIKNLTWKDRLFAPANPLKAEAK